MLSNACTEAVGCTELYDPTNSLACHNLNTIVISATAICLSPFPSNLNNQIFPSGKFISPTVPIRFRPTLPSPPYLLGTDITVRSYTKMSSGLNNQRLLPIALKETQAAQYPLEMRYTHGIVGRLSNHQHWIIGLWTMNELFFYLQFLKV